MGIIKIEAYKSKNASKPTLLRIVFIDCNDKIMYSKLIVIIILTV